MIGGRQRGLALAPVEIVESTVVMVETCRIRPTALPPRITPEEAAAHAAFVAKELGDKTLWVSLSV